LADAELEYPKGHVSKSNKTTGFGNNDKAILAYQLNMVDFAGSKDSVRLATDRRQVR
jgi:hypothetical protein